MPPRTLESLALRKAQVRADIQEKNKQMSSLLHGIFAPAAPAAGRAGNLVRQLNTGMAMFDGFMLGLRVVRRMRSVFKKK